MKEIQLYPLRHGKCALVDDEDFEELNAFHWTLNSCGYAIRHRPKSESGTRQIYMHRQIARAMEDEWVDHANHNTIDNRRANLRICNRSKNTCNSRLLARNKLGVKGVHLTKEGKYRAKVFYEGKLCFDKSFKTVEEAKAARDYHAKIHHKQFTHN